MSKVANIKSGAAGEPPSQAITRSSSGDSAEMKDKRGRKIVVRKISALQLYQITKMLGASADSQAALNIACAVAAVREIDGAPVAFPANDREIQAILARLDVAGLNAASTALESIKDEEGGDAAKN